jgi:CBS domain containing-hemolysin-like protein
MRRKQGCRPTTQAENETAASLYHGITTVCMIIGLLGLPTLAVLLWTFPEHAFVHVAVNMAIVVMGIVLVIGICGWKKNTPIDI